MRFLIRGDIFRYEGGGTRGDRIDRTAPTKKTVAFGEAVSDQLYPPLVGEKLGLREERRIEVHAKHDYIRKVNAPPVL